MIILNYPDPCSVLSFLDDQEPLLEDIEENGSAGDDYSGLPDSVYFSVDGNSLYTVVGTRIQRINLVTGDVLSKRVSRKACLTIGRRFRLVPVKRGVLFETNGSSLELWNSELSACMQRWTGFFVRVAVPLSEELVALETVNDDDGRREVIILDTTNEKIVSTIANFGGAFFACNNKCEVLTTTDGESLQLWRKNQVIWETSIQLDLSGLYVTVIFSPTEEYVVIFDEIGSYVLNAVSGKVICELEIMAANDIKFISNEDCIVSLNYPRGFCLRLYNVISGELLSEIVEERYVLSFAAYPRKRLVAIVLENSENHFEIIQVKLPGDKEKKNMKRSVETKFI